MIPPRKFRMQERRAAAASDPRQPTERDIQNIDAFSLKIAEAIDLLKGEIAAINAGELSIVSETFEKKSEVLKALELKKPLVEPFIGQEASLARKIPDRLAELKQVVTENSELLSRMASAAGAVAREIEKATQKHSLNGLYGKTGKKIENPNTSQMRVDRQF